MLTLSQPTEAKVVYTPTHRVINLGQSYDLDLNADGITDFALWVTSFCAQFCSYDLFVSEREGRVEVLSHRTNFARALQRGELIAPDKFVGSWPYAEMAAVGTFTTTSAKVFASGQWVNVKNRYLGLKFQINGQTHYGWARMNVIVDKQRVEITGTLTGYAYETIPDKAIIAGNRGSTTGAGPDVPSEPASLGQMALGASGMKRRDPMATGR